MIRPLNFAVIGCGQLARGKHLPNIVKSQRMVLHTCCDLSDQALDICREKFMPLHTAKDFAAVIANPEVEAICLATTEALRLPVIKLAAAAGKPVYTEKPLAGTLREAYQIQKVVNDSGIPFCVGHNRRNAPAMLEAYNIFRGHMTHPKPCPWRFQREADIPNEPDADVPAISVRINDDWHSWKGWVWDKTQCPHGLMLSEMTHMADLCNWFMASRPVSVMAFASGMLNHATIIQYENGGVASILMGDNGTFGYPKELYEIMGGGAMVVVDHMLEIRTAGIEGAPARKTYPMLTDRHPQIGTEGGFSGYMAKKQAAIAEATAKGDPSLIFTAEPDKGHARALERFVDEIRGEGPVVCSVDDAVVATEVCLAAVQSSHEHRAVKVAEIAAAGVVAANYV